MKVVPILVGAVNPENEAMYGKLLAKYVDDPNNFFSVSSDFCHWGSRYVLFPSSIISFLVGILWEGLLYATRNFPDSHSFRGKESKDKA